MTASLRIVGRRKTIKFLLSIDSADDRNIRPNNGMSPSIGTLFTDSSISSLIKPPNTIISLSSARTVLCISLLFVIKSLEFGSCAPAMLDTSTRIDKATESCSLI